MNYLALIIPIIALAAWLLISGKLILLIPLIALVGFFTLKIVKNQRNKLGK